MKPHFKPLANLLQTAWRKAIILHFTFSILHSAFAAVPVAWTNSPGMPPYPVKPVPHGVPVDFRVTLKGYTSPLIAPGADLHLWYQTNGMGRLWWPAPAALEGDAIVASFGPAQDTGADRVSLFFGAPSNVFASAVLRLTHSPGFAPNILPPPEQATFEETDPTVPDWAKAQTPPQTMTTNDVCAIVTNEVPAPGEFTAWKIASPYGEELPSGLAVVWGDWPGKPNYSDPYTGWYLEYNGAPNDSMALPAAEDINATHLYSAGDGGYAVVATRQRITQNALGLARLIDLPPLTNGLATAASVAAANTRASNAQTTANNVASTVSAWETYWDGDEVRVTVTNYDSSVHLPSLYIEQKIEDMEDYRVVWDERTRWESNDVQMAEMRSAIDEKADRAWGYYESHTGNYAPDGYTWLSSPRIAIAGGLAYQRTLTTYGAVWVLASNGLVAETNGDADTGYFRIKDDEGNTTFEIVRGNKRTVGATAAGIKVTSPRNSPTTTIEIPYNVTSDVPPTLYGTVSLSSPEWAEISATWTGQSGAWTGTVASSTSTYFIKGTYEVGGETYIKNVAPISVESGIYCTDGIHKVRPVYANGAITWEVVQ